MKIHFIAIGGSAMHNLAIALSRKGNTVTGSDDEIFEPSRSRLAREGILPASVGWDPKRITADIDAVILGMHAREDNPELARARDLDIPVYSYPEYVYESTRDKRRVVIGGSHGKTTVTSMILHVMRAAAADSDYLVGAQLEGYDCMVRLTDAAPIAVIEGDEYTASPLDRRPKFHLYKPHIALLTGVAWDHINVFPTFENYKEQFRIFVNLIEPGGTLVYYEGDPVLRALAAEARDDIYCVPYNTHPHRKENGTTVLTTASGEVPLRVFGDHNLQNISGAVEVLRRCEIPDTVIYTALSEFSGASKRLELVAETPDRVFYKDFAHAPSKLRATTAALKAQFPERRLTACMELHTFSSLNKDFLPLYEGAMEGADAALVYFNPKVIAHKRLDPISPGEVMRAFAGENVRVFTDTSAMEAALKASISRGGNLLMMSSGNFDGMDFEELKSAFLKVEV